MQNIFCVFFTQNKYVYYMSLDQNLGIAIDTAVFGYQKITVIRDLSNLLFSIQNG